MGFDSGERNTLLYADLFKGRKENQNTVIMSTCESSSSGFSTPVSSELDSSESDDSDFIAELTRQMAECMLQEEEQKQEQEQRNVKNYNNQSYTYSAAVKNLKNKSYSNAICGVDQTPPLQVYQLKNQPPMTMRKQVQKPEQHYMRRYRGRDWRAGHKGKGHDGSGMRAIFLGGSGFRNGCSGTGVFLPNDPVEPKKKSGCSTVLIPTRVLQALELHFKRLSDSAAPPLRGASLRDERTKSNMDEVMQLPQEWTY